MCVLLRYLPLLRSGKLDTFMEQAEHWLSQQSREQPQQQRQPTARPQPQQQPKQPPKEASSGWTQVQHHKLPQAKEKDVSVGMELDTGATPSVAGGRCRVPAVQSRLCFGIVLVWACWKRRQYCFCS